MQNSCDCGADRKAVCFETESYKPVSGNYRSLFQQFTF